MEVITRGGGTLVLDERIKIVSTDTLLLLLALLFLVLLDTTVHGGSQSVVSGRVEDFNFGLVLEEFEHSFCAQLSPFLCLAGESCGC